VDTYFQSTPLFTTGGGPLYNLAQLDAMHALYLQYRVAGAGSWPQGTTMLFICLFWFGLVCMVWDCCCCFVLFCDLVFWLSISFSFEWFLASFVFRRSHPRHELPGGVGQCSPHPHRRLLAALHAELHLG
jgi:hypothetical protein